MRLYHSATALALITTTAFAQQCPPGYQRSTKLDWKFCGQGIQDSTLECATIEVPKDWNNAATSDKLALQLIRQPSKNPNAKSIITNPGGPGESGIEMIINSNIGLQQTLGDFHIVSFDPRGVGLTMPYKDCKATESSKWKDPIADNDDQATVEFKAAKAWSDACAAENKELGTLIGTAYVARDIMAIVEALEAAGEDGLIRYAGYSYGTLLGATLAAMFPDKVARVLLDGNINPTDYYRGDGIEAGTDVTKGIENFFAQCADAGKDNCALVDNNQSAQKLLAEYNELLDKLTKTDPSKNSIVRNEFFQVLYFKKPTAFKDFAVDLKAWIVNPDSVKERSNKRDEFQASKWQKLKQNQAIMGITCGDRIIKDGSPAKYTQLKEAYQQRLGTNYDLSMAGQFECLVWEQNAAERFMGTFSDIRTNQSILLVNTPWDPVTPAISAEASRKAFRGAKLVMSNGVGHCSGAHYNPELNAAIKKYFEKGDLPDRSEYNIADNNVFRKVPEPPAVSVDETGVPISKRDFKLPDYFQKRADSIPVGCTQIPVSSSALVLASASIVPSASASLSVSMSASASVSQSPEPTPAVSPSASVSALETIVLSQSESASASVVAVPTASVSMSQEPTPSASVWMSTSLSSSASIFNSHSESASASEAAMPSASTPHSEFASILATASASVSASYEGPLSSSASASASLVLSHSESSSAFVSAQLSSGSLQASVTPSASVSESYAVTATPSISAHSASDSNTAAHVSSSVVYSGVSLSGSASASVTSERDSQSSAFVISASVSADMISSSAVTSTFSYASNSMNYAATGALVTQSSSYPIESITPSASVTPLYNQGSTSITASASYPAASSVEPSGSSATYSSSDVGFPHPASSSSVYLDVSSSVYPDSSSSVVSSLASLTYSTPTSSSSAIYSDSSIFHPSASPSIVHPDASAYPSGPSSVGYSQSSQSTPGSSSVIDYSRTSLMGSSSAGGYYPASTPIYSSGSSTASTSYTTKPVHDHYATSRLYAYTTASRNISSEYPYSSSLPAYSSSTAPYRKGDDYGSDAYPTGYYSTIRTDKPKGPKTTSAPCITVAWSSQPGYVPVTKTYTTTSVRTITRCPDSVKNCPLNSSTKTYITTEIKTRTTVVATPSSSPADGKSYPPNKESGKKSSAPPSRETSKVPSPPKNSGYPSQPAKDTGSGGKSATSQPVKTTSYPSQPSKPTGNSPQLPKETKPIQYTQSVYAPPKISSKPSVPTSVPPYPTGPSAPSSIKVCNDMKCSYVAVPTGTKPVVGTGASTTLKTSTPSVSVCFGKDCKSTGTPTGYKPAEFTGAASGNFVSSILGASALIAALVRFF